MKKIFLAFAISGVALCSSSFAKAAPGPWGIALNANTKECAGFWPGDEFVAYSLPDGWKSYFPKYDPDTQKTTLTTDIGECDFKIREEAKCCEQLGYKFVSDNIGKDQKTILRDRAAFEAALKNQREKPSRHLFFVVSGLVIIAIIITIILIRKRKKKKSEN